MFNSHIKVTLLKIAFIFLPTMKEIWREIVKNDYCCLSYFKGGWKLTKRASETEKN